MKHFSLQVNSMSVNTSVKKLHQTNKNAKFKSKTIFTEINANKAGAVKVSRKITTQHRQLIFHEIFKKKTPSHIKS